MFSISRFGELMNGVPRQVFSRSVRDSGADRYAKTLKSWDLLTLMIYGQIKQSASLRSLVSGFNVQEAHHYHLNTGAMRLSTVSDALSKRSVEPFQRLCEGLMGAVCGGHRREVSQLLWIIDSTPVSLRGWRYAAWTAAHRTPTSEGLKVHLAMDVEHDAPRYAKITHMNVNDMRVAHEIEIVAGTTYIMDKAYCNYNWWYSIDQADAFFVTRLKNNAQHRVERDRAIEPADEGSILADQIIQLTNKSPGGGRTNAYAYKDLRRIKVYRQDNPRPLIIVTNDMQRSAREIADLYKRRWRIELLFKWLKQKLKIKTTFGLSENAVRIQIYCALITYLLIAMFRQRNAIDISLSELILELKETLFERRTAHRDYYHRRRRRREFIAQRQWVLFA